MSRHHSRRNSRRNSRRESRRDREEISVAVLVEAKKEYTEQLVNFLYPQIYRGLQSIWDNAKIQVKQEYQRAVSENPNSDDEPKMRSALIAFQEKLTKVPQWNDEILTNEYSRIIEDSNCDWYDELITAVFISHVKVLSSVRLGKKEKPIELKVPSSKNFVHKCYIVTARKFFENPFLIEDREERINYLDIQKNLQESYRVIGNCIKEAIQKLLPTRDILQSYLEPEPEYPDSENSDRESESNQSSHHSDRHSDNSIESDGGNRSEDITSGISPQKQDAIKELVKKELEAYVDEPDKPKPPPEEEDDFFENLSTKPFRNISEREPNLDVSGDHDTGMDQIDRDREREYHDREYEYNNDHEEDPDDSVLPIPTGDEIEDSESTKQVIVPASKRLQKQKEAEETLIPEIKRKVEENPEIQSDTLFLSDGESD